MTPFFKMLFFTATMIMIVGEIKASAAVTVLQKGAQEVYLYIVDDSVVVKLKNNKIETIEVNIRVENNTDSIITLNKQTGIIDPGSLPGELFPDFCKTSDYRGTFRKFLFSNDDISLTEDFHFNLNNRPYFTKSGKLKYSQTGGFVKPNKLKRRLKEEDKLRASDIKVNITPNGSLEHKVKVYLRNYKLEINQNYYLVIAYNNKRINSLSQICLISNRLKIVTK